MAIRMEERLDHARDALNAYFKSKGENPRAGDDFEDTDVSDLIADLLHLQTHLKAWKALERLSRVDACIMTALIHYQAEQKEENIEAGKEFRSYLPIGSISPVIDVCLIDKKTEDAFINQHSNAEFWDQWAQHLGLKRKDGENNASLKERIYNISCNRILPI